MKEKELIALGFNRKDVTAEESGEENDWYYYELDFAIVTYVLSLLQMIK